MGAPPAPPPPPGSGESGKDSAAATPSDAHRSLPTPFLTKTYQLVDDPGIDDIISWNEDGSTFVVWRPAEFARDLLPKYFKHNNFSSFVRQLNTYGFRKIVPDRWEFANDCFRKGEKRLLADIHRRKNNPLSAAPAAAAAAPGGAQQVQAVPQPATPGSATALPDSGDVSPPNSTEEMETPPSTSSPSAAAAVAVAAAAAAVAAAAAAAAPSTSSWSAAATTVTADLIDENERLRKENMHLNQELSQMKSLCNNILLLMSNYANRHQGSPSGSGSGTKAADLRKDVLELMPMRASSSDDSSHETIDRAKPEECGSGASPMLFGVHIGVKRLRVVDDPDGSGSSNGPDSCSGEEYQQQRQQQQEQTPHKMVTDVKSEQLDGGVSDGEEPSSDSRWLSCGRG